MISPWTIRRVMWGIAIIACFSFATVGLLAIVDALKSDSIVFSGRGIPTRIVSRLRSPADFWFVFTLNSLMAAIMVVAGGVLLRRMRRGGE